MRTTNVQLKNCADVLDVKDLSSVLGVCEKTAYALLKNGDIDSVRIGNRYKIPKKNIYKYLNGKKKR